MRIKEKIADFVRHNKLYIIIFAVLIAQQVFFIAKFPPITEIDTASYYEPARNFLETGTMYSDRRMPGYPLMLAAAIKMFPSCPDIAIIVLQHCMGLAIWVAAIALLKNKRLRIAFSVFWLIDMLFNSYQHCLLTETPLAFFVFFSAAVFVLLRPKKEKETKSAYPVNMACLISGLCIALGFLMKPVMYLFFLFAAPLFYFSDSSWGGRLRKYALFVLMPVITVNMVCLNNMIISGKYVFMPYSASYYIEYVINFAELPKNAKSAGIIDWKSYHRYMDNEEKMKVATETVIALKAAGFSTAEADKELKMIAAYSAFRHPLLFLHKMAIETAHFYLNAHNHYVKHYYKGKMPFSMGMAIRDGDYVGAAKKMLFSLHIIYWLLFLSFIYSICLNAKKIAVSYKKYGKAILETKISHNFFNLYSYWIIVYVTLVTVMVCQGDARYRTAIQPLMLILAIKAISKNRGNKDLI